MSHHHGHHHHDHDAEGNISVAFFLNLAFTIIEIIGGFYTSSLAVLSDALHDLGDSFSLGLSWYFQRVSKKGRTKTFSYGYRRFSLLGAVINSVVLIVGSIIILYHAIPELFNPSETDAKGMMWLAILGVIVNGAAVLRLKKGTSLNERVVMLHLLEDALGWVAVLIGSIVMIFFDLPIIDPMLSVLISAFVLFNVFRNLKKSLRVILQGTPEDISIDEMRKKLQELPEVRDVHDCHVWSLDGEYNVLTAHISLGQNYLLSEQEALKQKVKDLLKDEQIQHITIEFEQEGEDCESIDC